MTRNDSEPRDPGVNGSLLTPVAAESCSRRMCEVPAAVQAPALIQLSRYEAGVVDESEYRRNEGVERPRPHQLVLSIKYILLAGFRISGQYSIRSFSPWYWDSKKHAFPRRNSFPLTKPSTCLPYLRQIGSVACWLPGKRVMDWYTAIDNRLFCGDVGWGGGVTDCRRRALRDRWLGRVHWPKCVVPGCSPSWRWPWRRAVRTCRPAQVEAARAGTNGRRLISAC